MPPNFEVFLHQFSGGRLLDVATGLGGFIHTLIANLKDYSEIIGVDIFDNHAHFSAAFKELPVRFEQMDAALLNFPDASFDTVSISNSLHHLSDVPGVLAEMRRVLKPEGHFLFAEMYRDGQTEAQLMHVLLHQWWAEVDTAVGISHRQTYTRQEVVDILTSLDLDDLELFDESDLSGDLKDPQRIQEVDGIIDRHIVRANGLAGQVALQARGEELRRRVHAVGFHPATVLCAAARKMLY